MSLDVDPDEYCEALRRAERAEAERDRFRAVVEAVREDERVWEDEQVSRYGARKALAALDALDTATGEGPSPLGHSRIVGVVPLPSGSVLVEVDHLEASASSVGVVRVLREGGDYTRVSYVGRGVRSLVFPSAAVWRDPSLFAEGGVLFVPLVDDGAPGEREPDSPRWDDSRGRG